jgi:hypothetical protein
LEMLLDFELHRVEERAITADVEAQHVLA